MSSLFRKKPAPDLPFAVGDRVADPWGNLHEVLSIDPTANHGLGAIRTRRQDGTELTWSVVAHGLEPVAGPGGEA